MKRFLASLAAAAAIAAPSWALNTAVNQNLANETLTGSKTYTMDFGQNQVDFLTAQINLSSASPAASTFTDGQQSTGSLTVTSTSALKGFQATDTITVSSGATLAGTYFTINHQGYFAGQDFTPDVRYSSNTAASIAAAVNSEDDQGVTAATTSASVVTLTVQAFGPPGNSFTLFSSSAAYLHAGTTNFTGGVYHTYIVVNNTALTEGTDWQVSTATGTAASIGSAINTSSNTIGVTETTTLYVTSGTVTVTSILPNFNRYRLFTNAPSGITLSGANMTGGDEPDINLSTSTLTVAAHGLAEGQAVLYTASAGGSIGGLSSGTTYFVILIDPNDVQLSATSTGSYSGANITLTSFPANGPHTYTLTPLPLTGTVSTAWFTSEDGVNWSTLNVSSVTFASPYTAQSTVWDFGPWDHRFLQLPVTGPTQGGVRFQAVLFGKRSGRP